MTNTYILLFIATFLAGVINTVAGSGGILVMPMMIAFGIPVPIANGTYRLAVLSQSMISFSLLKKKKIIAEQHAIPFISFVPCILGAMIGAYTSTLLDPKYFYQILIGILIVLLFLLLLKPQKWLNKTQNNFSGKPRLGQAVLLFIVGLYGGFMQLGMGILLLSTFVLMMNMNLIKANYYKIAVILMYTIPVLIIFAYHKSIDWKLGAWLALGQGLGGWAGTYFLTLKKKIEIWIYRLLIVLISTLIIRLIMLI